LPFLQTGPTKEAILKHYKEGYIKGFTTNPTLMAKAGITDYQQFADPFWR